jgi:hypothetical protein
MWNTFPQIEPSRGGSMCIDQPEPAGIDFNGHAAWSHYTASLSVCPPRPVVLAHGKKQKRGIISPRRREKQRIKQMRTQGRRLHATEPKQIKEKTSRESGFHQFLRKNGGLGSTTNRIPKLEAFLDATQGRPIQAKIGHYKSNLNVKIQRSVRGRGNATESTKNGKQNARGWGREGEASPTLATSC